jgi:hypothetical protein
MPNPRSDGKPRSAPVGRVKAARRASGSAQALALTRPAGVDNTSISRSPLTNMIVAEECAKRASRRTRARVDALILAPSSFETSPSAPLSSRQLPLRSFCEPLRSQWNLWLTFARDEGSGSATAFERGLAVPPAPRSVG